MGPNEGGEVDLVSPPVPVAAVSCGGFFTMVLTADRGRATWNWGGKLYMWGNAKDSQLRVTGLLEIQPCPVEVKFLMEDDGLDAHNVLSVAFGASHDSMCLVSRSSC
ncbi:hypothetical protein Dsin_007145 [Dipteronia sinensis]|uniref:Uncharacterized protein n=1 Tax=Dipteronia sinensis TaxID=43782 RepID=A0AAE0B0L0_9ROSI|nr:hypothetical protein Dsin_007145 [Dipteronia sinensis]